MILVLTDRNDVHADIVIKLLLESNADVLRFNLDVQSLEKTFITFNRDNHWFVQTEERSFYLNEVTCVWNRKTFVQLMLEEQNGNYEFNIWKNEWNKTVLGLYYYLSELPWLNYYRDNHKAENKYFQMAVAKELNLNLPDFILTNSKADLASFCLKHKKVVLKMMNQDFYKINEGEYQGFYVNVVGKEHLEGFSDTEENPVFIQEYIDKKYEVRYTVVGEEHFVCKIESQSSEVANIDWRRYDLPNTPHTAMEAPMKIKEAVSKLLKRMNLTYGALDFIVDRNDEWYFLEINPAGQYLWIEDLAGLKISESIKNWLYSNK